MVVKGDNMKKVVFVVLAMIITTNLFSQEFGSTVEQLKKVRNGLVERTTDEDREINRQRIAYKEHPDDPNYDMIYTQNYEEEFFFINNKLYFIVKEFRAQETQWKNLLAGFPSKYRRTENSSTTPDGSWFINTITFNNDTEQYQVFIYRPSQRWNTVYKFAPGEAVVRVVGRHYQYLKEYQNANADR